MKGFLRFFLIALMVQLAAWVFSACQESPSTTETIDTAVIGNIAIWYDRLPDTGLPGFVDEDGKVFVTDFGGNMPDNDRVIEVFYDPCGTVTRIDDIPLFWEYVDE